jgi:HSP90 family molecular chaperone
MTEQTIQNEFYLPPVKKEAPLKLDSDLLACSSKLPDIIKVRLKDSAVAHQIATGLYKSPQAGFRELYSNERRAAHTARQKFDAKPSIEVTVNTEHRQLIVQGYDSLGITAKVFVDVLRWMGRTTNNDENEIGQFGWGFFALWTMANSVELQTYARETNERYGVTAKDAGAFTLLPDEQVTIQEHGTRIQLNLKNDPSYSSRMD